MGGFAISAHASGPVSNPAVMVRGLLRKTTALGQRFDTVELKAAGGLKRAHVETRFAGENLRTYELTSDLELDPRFALSDLRLAVAQSQDSSRSPLVASSSGGAVRVSGLEIKARGGRAGFARLRREPRRARARGERLRRRCGAPGARREVTARGERRRRPHRELPRKARRSASDARRKGARPRFPGGCATVS